jgi:hypothetical protein
MTLKQPRSLRDSARPSNFLEEEWVAAFARFDAALSIYRTNLRSIAERLRTGEIPTETELQRELEARTRAISKLITARRATTLRFAADPGAGLNQTPSTVDAHALSSTVA